MKFTRYLFLIAIVLPFCAHAEDDFNFDDMTIVASDDADVTNQRVSMNDDTGPANVSGFDIAGIILGMPFDDVQTLFFKTKGLYAPRQDHSIIYTIHKDWKYNLDYECRQNNIVVPSELEKCINSLAYKRGLLYASELHLVRTNTGETIDVYFTSNASDNLVWRVVYNNDVNNMEGDNEKFENQREKKILAFWQSVLDKYGAPNSDSDKWITSNNAYDPMMQAYYGSLDLQDKGRYTADDTKNVQQARQNFKAKPYAF